MHRILRTGTGAAGLAYTAIDPASPKQNRTRSGEHHADRRRDGQLRGPRGSGERTFHNSRSAAWPAPDTISDQGSVHRIGVGRLARTHPRIERSITGESPGTLGRCRRVSLEIRRAITELPAAFTVASIVITARSRPGCTPAISITTPPRIVAGQPVLAPPSIRTFRRTCSDRTQITVLGGLNGTTAVKSRVEDVRHPRTDDLRRRTSGRNDGPTPHESCRNDGVRTRFKWDRSPWVRSPRGTMRLRDATADVCLNPTRGRRLLIDSSSRRPT